VSVEVVMKVWSAMGAGALLWLAACGGDDGGGTKGAAGTGMLPNPVNMGGLGGAPPGPAAGGPAQPGPTPGGPIMSGGSGTRAMMMVAGNCGPGGRGAMGGAGMGGAGMGATGGMMGGMGGDMPAGSGGVMEPMTAGEPKLPMAPAMCPMIATGNITVMGQQVR